MMATTQLIPAEVIEQRIFLIRGQRVILDKDLAGLYGVETFNLNKAVNRNLDRFPADFMFQLTREESENLIFHFGISRWGGTRKLPYAFTEQGITMLSSVLRSKRAVQVNIQIMRAFVKLREFLLSHRDLAAKLAELEKKYETHDRQIKAIFDAIRQLMQPSGKPRKQIGFKVEEPKVHYSACRRTGTA